jgi:hypothetical protein
MQSFDPSLFLRALRSAGSKVEGVQVVKKMSEEEGLKTVEEAEEVLFGNVADTAGDHTNFLDAVGIEDEGVTSDDAEVAIADLSKHISMDDTHALEDDNIEDDNIEESQKPAVDD